MVQILEQVLQGESNESSWKPDSWVRWRKKVAEKRERKAEVRRIEDIFVEAGVATRDEKGEVTLSNVNIIIYGLDGKTKIGAGQMYMMSSNFDQAYRITLYNSVEYKYHYIEYSEIGKVVKATTDYVEVEVEK